VHGANRLGGNSLLETIVFGRLSGASAAAYVSELRDGLAITSSLVQEEGEARTLTTSLMAAGQCEEVAALRDELNSTMTQKVGIFRDRAAMEEALEAIGRLKQRYREARVSYTSKRFNLALLRALELRSMLEVAEIIALGALRREESRGGHSRTDFPQRDDEHWLRHTMACCTADGPALQDKEVVITMFQPEARKY
jgi:succinate dehydrogenase / fumarate reductase flavoprotein subunit